MMNNEVIWLVLAPLLGAAVALLGKTLGTHGKAFAALSLLPLAVGAWVLLSTYPAVSAGTTSATPSP